MSSTAQLSQMLRGNLIDINAAISTVTQLAKDREVPASQLRDLTGNFILHPLLLAKAQTLNGLAILAGGPKR